MINSAYVAPYDQWIPRNGADASTYASSAALKTASYLTDPACKSREFWVRSLVLDDLPSASPRICNFLYFASYLPFCSFLAQDEYAKWFEFYYLRSASVGLALTSCFTAPLGIALRAIVGNIASGPFHYRGSFPEKEREGNWFSHLLRNICGIEGGYDIEEGAQMPIRDDLNYIGSDRIDHLIEQIRSCNPDVLCLNEVFDFNDAHYIANALKDQYAHFIFQCGTRSVGPNSGLFFASKFGVSHSEFKPFPKEMLVGDTKQCEKGVLIVDIKDSQGYIATIALTHGQHSDAVRHGTDEEKEARANQLQFIQNALTDKSRVVITGDFNMDDDEMKEAQNVDIYQQFVKTTAYHQEGKEEFTWGGDEWYVSHGNKTADYPVYPSSIRKELRKVSTGCNLDHTMVSKKTMSVNSVLLKDPTPYDPCKLSRESLSDHKGVLSVVTFNP